ncbi:MAG TPA: amidohydrolase family protein [Novosphingobium sp.]|nr:amidohydrolase family protein [Novosphingobium sp.]
MLDLKIVGGTIMDGSGGAPFVGSIGIKGDRIVAVGDVQEDAAEVIDATGRVVSPGFVDVHTHYDAQAFWDPTFSPSCFHGVTTILGGFCGFSIAPLSPESGAYLLPMLARVEGMPQDTLKAGVPWDWRTFGEYLSRLDGRVLLNAGFFVGHSAVRRLVMGERANAGEATAEEIAAMQAWVDQSLAEGALGFSTTVSPSHNDGDGNPVPSRFASRDEVVTLASTVRNHEGTSLELLPNLMEFDERMVDLLVDCSLAGGRPLNWNVLTVGDGGAEDRKRIETLLQPSRIARQKGAEVLALTFASAPTLRVNFVSGFVFDSIPGWAPLFKLPLDRRLEALKDPFIRETLRSAAGEPKPGKINTNNWDCYIVIETFKPENKRFEGRMIRDIAKELGKSYFDTLLDIVVSDELRTSVMREASGEDAQGYKLRAELWHDDDVIIGASDAGAHMDMIDTFAFSTLLLQNARKYGLMTLPETVHRLTQVPARALGIKDRGLLAEGLFADVVIFDGETVGRGPVYTRYDLPGTDTEGRLYADAIGIDCVIVNGKVAVRNGAVTDVRPGTVFRSGRDTFTRPIPALENAA